MKIEHESVYEKDFLTWKSVLLKIFWLPLLGMTLGNLPMVFLGFHLNPLSILLQAVLLIVFITILAVAEMRIRRDTVKMEELLWQVIDSMPDPSLHQAINSMTEKSQA